MFEHISLSLNGYKGKIIASAIALSLLTNGTLQSEPSQKVKDLIERSKKCSDMLVRLYELPDIRPLLENLQADGITIRRAHASEKHLVTSWVKEKFSAGWADECEIAFSKHPFACFLATKDNQIIGFSIHNSTAPGFAGPIGIDESYRGKGFGKALFIQTLIDMRSKGYPYAIIGWVAPKTQAFFRKAVKADVIERSDPLNGAYKGLLID